MGISLLISEASPGFSQSRRVFSHIKDDFQKPLLPSTAGDSLQRLPANNPGQRGLLKSIRMIFSMDADENAQ